MFDFKAVELSSPIFNYVLDLYTCLNAKIFREIKIEIVYF